jgi:hypothetical protein
MNLNNPSNWKYLGNIDHLGLAWPANLVHGNNHLFCSIRGFGLWRYKLPSGYSDEIALPPGSEVQMFTKNSITSNLEINPDISTGMLKITDLSGRVLYKANLNEIRFDKISFGNFKPGVYIISIESKNHIEAKKVFVP